jgi:hypothetical protein
MQGEAAEVEVAEALIGVPFVIGYEFKVVGARNTNEHSSRYRRD